MNTLTDDALVDALTTAAGSFPDPAPSTRVSRLAAGEPAEPWWQRRAVKLGSVAAALLVGVLLVQSTDATLFSSRSDVTGTAVSVMQQPGSLDTGGEAVAGTTGATGGLGAPPVDAAPQSVPDASARDRMKGSAGSGAIADSAAQDAPRVVKTGSVSLIVDKGKVGAAVTKLRALATSVRGYVAEESSQELGDNPSATVTMRVPVASFDSVMTELRSKGFGAKVVSAESSGRDITASYADTQAQLRSLEAARGRYLAILREAKSLGQVLEVQQRVDGVQAQIDRLEGSRRVLASQSDLATLNVSVADKDNEALRTEKSNGFGKAWDDAKDGFTSGLEALVARSGRTLLVLIVAAVLLVVGRFGWRIARRRMI